MEDEVLVSEELQDDEDFSGGEDELFSAIRDLAKEDAELEDSEDDSEDADIEDETDEEELDDAEEDEDEEESDEDEEELEEEHTKKEQSKEENAKFAAQRREQELQKRVQAELERIKQESPEFKVAQRLSKMYGRPVEQIMEELEEAELAKEAEETNISIDRLKQERQVKAENERLQAELNQLKFESWQNRIQADGAKLIEQYPMLSQEDVDSAVNYMLYTAKNAELPLEDAVFAVHGKKIVQALGQQKVQDDLAKQSGRVKKTPLKPNNGKPAKTTSLTSEEQYVARQMGLSDADYLKYKS